jgi:hypothetical protein
MATVVKKCSCANQARCKHSWVVRYRAGGRQRERSFRPDQKSVANDFALKVEHDKKAGVFIDPKPKTDFPPFLYDLASGTHHDAYTAPVKAVTPAGIRVNRRRCCQHGHQ